MYIFQQSVEIVQTKVQVQGKEIFFPKLFYGYKLFFSSIVSPEASVCASGEFGLDLLAIPVWKMEPV